MRQKYLIFILVLALSIPHLGTVRRTEDPIRDTQTSPILYKQKMEEEKDGKKGPLTYNVKYNPSDTFLVDPPFAPDEKESEQRYEADSAMDWWEEVPVSGKTTVAEETENVFDSNVKEGEAAAPSDSATGDYWW